MNKAIAVISTCMIATGGFATGGCSDNDQTDVFFVTTATGSVDVVVATNDVDSLVFFATESLDTALVPGTANRAVVAARSTADSVAVVFGSCATATVSNATVTVNMNGCTGPLGLTRATGTVAFAFEDLGDGNGIRITITSNQLTTSNGTLKIAETATVNSVNGTRTAMVHSTTTGTTTGGVAIEVTGDSTLTWQKGATCATLNGTFTRTASDGTVLSSQVTNFTRCAGQCPTGTITTSAADGRAVTITMSGTAVASFTGSNGTTGTLNLTCP